MQWFYPKGLKWRGVVIWVVLPVPLMVPIGRDYEILTFHGNECVDDKYQIDEGFDSGLQCGLLPDASGGSAPQCQIGPYQGGEKY